MQKHFTVASLALCLAILASCQPALREQDIVAQGARRVTGDELLSLHIDKTFYGNFADTGNPWTEYHYPDGRAMYRERSRPEAGTWAVTEDQVCYSYAWNENSERYCFFLYVNDGRYYHVDANGDDIGTVSNVIEIRPGDPEGLAN